MELSLRARTAAVELITSGGIWDAFQLGNAVANVGPRYDESLRFDWHEYAYLLDRLSSQGLVRFIDNNGPDGHSRYTLAKG